MKLVDEKSPNLLLPSKEFDFSNPPEDPEQLAKQMHAFMIESKGIGLAAPQIGNNTRIFTMGNDDTFLACFNPQIIKQSDDKVVDYEGCLSFPGLYMKVLRPVEIEVRYQDYKGNFIEDKFNDIWARCFSHELDHLNGVTFCQRVSKMVLDMAKRKRAKKK